MFPSLLVVFEKILGDLYPIEKNTPKPKQIRKVDDKDDTILPLSDTPMPSSPNSNAKIWWEL